MRLRRTLHYTVPASDGRRSAPEVHTRFSAARRKSPEASVVRFRFAKHSCSFPFRKHLEVSDAFGRFSEGLFPFRKVPRADAGERGGVHDRPAGAAGRRRRWQGGHLRRVSAEGSLPEVSLPEVSVSGVSFPFCGRFRTLLCAGSRTQRVVLVSGAGREWPRLAFSRSNLRIAPAAIRRCVGTMIEGPASM
jgi:hypothetical protein